MNTNALKEGMNVAKKSLIYLLILGILKLTAGILTGMTVVTADAVKSFASTLGIFASYIGLKLSRKNADKNFEYGYHKIETFAALLVSIGIVYLGGVMLYRSIGTLDSSPVGNFRLVAIITTILAILHSYRLSAELKVAGQKTNSLSLLVNAKTKQMDLIAGVAVLISILANYDRIPYVEGIVSIVISLIILKEGLFSTKESLFFLLDYWDDPSLSRKIRKILSKEKDIVMRINKIRLRRAGTLIFGEAFIDINQFAGIQDLREETNILEEKICKINPYIKDFAIFTHISKAEKMLIAVPIKKDLGLNSEIAPNLKETHAYLFVTLHDRKIGKPYVKELGENQKSFMALNGFLKSEKINILVDNKLSSLIYFNLRETHHILIYPSFPDVKKVKQMLDLMLIDT
jgi:cation diffusion facilitator family transporter